MKSSVWRACCSVLLQFDGVPGRIVDPDLHRARPLHGALIRDVAIFEFGDGLVEILHCNAIVVPR